MRSGYWQNYITKPIEVLKSRIWYSKFLHLQEHANFLHLLIFCTLSKLNVVLKLMIRRTFSTQTVDSLCKADKITPPSA